MGAMGNAYEILVGNREDKRPLLREGVRIILEWILGKLRTGFIWLRIRTSGGLFEHGNEPLGSMKGG
jgi:hypothetical protein